MECCSTYTLKWLKSGLKRSYRIVSLLSVCLLFMFLSCKCFKMLNILINLNFCTKHKFMYYFCFCDSKESQKQYYQ